MSVLVTSLQINNPKRLAGDKSKSIDARPLLFPINCQLPSNETKRKKKLPLSSIGDCYLSLSLKSDSMARTSTKQSDKNKVGVFFLATLLLWSVSVLFEIAFNKRKELLFIVAGACFFQIANWVIRLLVSRDPLFVNTSVSLLHSTITSVSGSIILSFLTFFLLYYISFTEVRIWLFCILSILSVNAVLFVNS